MEGGMRDERGIHHKGTKDTKEDTKERANALSRQVIGAAIEVHKGVGPGLLESAYQKCLCRELMLRGIPHEAQVPLPLTWKGVELDCSYRLDIVVDNLIIVELKAVEAIEPIHEAQLLTYLRLKPLWLGLLINFNVVMLRDGLRRIVN
jgi:GxxExxY protein